MRRITGAVGFLMLTAVAVLPSAASASTTVWAGPPPGTQTQLSKKFLKQYQPDVNDFFQHRVTITVGSTVTFKLGGFHTVDLPGKTGQDLPLLIPGAPVSGVNDAAGNPFWFNGKVPAIGINPALFAGSGPRRYDGSTRIDSGLPLNPKVKPLNVQFTKAGTYKFYCDVHPGMVGYVVVKPKDEKVPTAKQNAAALRAQVATDAARMLALSHTKQVKDTVHVGEAGAGGVELFNMFPATLQVKAGTVVTFTMSPDSHEVHTAAFGSTSVLKTLANGFNGPVFPAQGVYPSDPTVPIPISTTSHGNGFANTGVLDSDPATATIHPSSKIDFTTPGVYHFVCLIHPFMHGTIIVK